MAGSFRIVCIRKPDRENVHSRIREIGFEVESFILRVSLNRAIELIEKEGHEFYTEENGKQVSVQIAYRNGEPYLTTAKDETEENNLLRLPECPR